MARDAVAEVRERTDIVDLVSQYVQLKKTGRSYKGLCPFHQEKTPSFVVFPESGNFHCFGCGKGGDAFTFYMGVEHVEFRDALQELARRAGVELSPCPEPAAGSRRSSQPADRAERACRRFLRQRLAQHRLPAQPAASCSQQRGVSAEIAERFGSGSPPTAIHSAAI